MSEPTPRWGGIFTIVTTPFSDDGRLDLPAAGVITDFLIASGATNLVLLGSEGECYSLTPDERRQFIRTVAQAANDRALVIAGVSDPSPEAAHQLAVFAGSVGCDAVLTTGPYYVKYNGAGLRRYLDRVVEAGMPCLFYNNPSRVGYAPSPAEIRDLALATGIVAVKQAALDAGQLVELVDICQRDQLSVVGGAETTILPALAAGARGNTTTGGTALPELFRDLWAAATGGRWQRAAEIFRMLAPVRAAYRQSGGQAAVTKKLLELRGLPGGPVREPLDSLSPRTVSLLTAFVAEQGLGQVAG